MWLGKGPSSRHNCRFLLSAWKSSRTSYMISTHRQGSSSPPESVGVLESGIAGAKFSLAVSNQEAGSIQYCSNRFSGLFRPRCIDVRLPVGQPEQQRGGLRHPSAVVGSPSLSPEPSIECMSSNSSSSSGDLDVSVSSRPNWWASCRRWMPWSRKEGRPGKAENEKCPESDTEDVKTDTLVRVVSVFRGNLA